MVALHVFEGDLKEAADVCGGRGYGESNLTCCIERRSSIWIKRRFARENGAIMTLGILSPLVG
jgi:hypothetical protein